MPLRRPTTERLSRRAPLITPLKLTRREARPPAGVLPLLRLTGAAEALRAAAAPPWMIGNAASGAEAADGDAAVGALPPPLALLPFGAPIGTLPPLPPAPKPKSSLVRREARAVSRVAAGAAIAGPLSSSSSSLSLASAWEGELAPDRRL